MGVLIVSLPKTTGRAAVRDLDARLGSLLRPSVSRPVMDEADGLARVKRLRKSVRNSREHPFLPPGRREPADEQRNLRTRMRCSGEERSMITSLDG